MAELVAQAITYAGTAATAAGDLVSSGLGSLGVPANPVPNLFGVSVGSPAPIGGGPTSTLLGRTAGAAVETGLKPLSWAAANPTATASLASVGATVGQLAAGAGGTDVANLGKRAGAARQSAITGDVARRKPKGTLLGQAGPRTGRISRPTLLGQR